MKPKKTPKFTRKALRAMGTQWLANKVMHQNRIIQRQAKQKASPQDIYVSKEIYDLAVKEIANLQESLHNVDMGIRRKEAELQDYKFFIKELREAKK